MVIVAHSIFNLKRQRQELQRQFERRDWHAVRHVDLELQKALDVAQNDPACEKHVFLAELEKVVGLYRTVTLACQLYGMDIQYSPGT